jgi:hypothetical protein
MIDVHTHPVMIKELVEQDAALNRSIHEVFGFHFPAQPLECFLLEMDEAGIETAVLLPLDCTTAHGCTIVSNQQVAGLVEKSSRFIGFASVDPCLPDAPQRLEREVISYGLRGLKLDPSLQRFNPGDRQYAYPLYQVCASLGIPVLLHCGMSWAPSGLAQLAQPLLLEEAVQAFPNLNFILAHFCWPWVQEATLLAIKYPNVFLDTAILFSGTPRDAMHHVIADQVGLDVVERSLFNKLVFGSNYPRVDMRRMVRGVRALGLSPATEQAILGGNAHRLLNSTRQP